MRARIVGLVMGWWRSRDVMREMGAPNRDRKEKDIAEARITCRYRMACALGWSSAYWGCGNREVMAVGLLWLGGKGVWDVEVAFSSSYS